MHSIIAVDEGYEPRCEASINPSFDEELNLYERERNRDLSSYIKLTSFWTAKKDLMPQLYWLFRYFYVFQVRNYLVLVKLSLTVSCCSIPYKPTSTPSERVFSMAGRRLTSRRMRILSETFREEMLLASNPDLIRKEVACPRPQLKAEDESEQFWEDSQEASEFLGEVAYELNLDE